MFSRTACLLFYFISACSVYLRAEERWLDITAEAGLDHHPTSRVKFANLNNDLWPDIVMQPESGEGESPTIYLHSGTTDTVRYIRKTDTNLPSVYPGDTLVFADLDNDGNQDAILGRYLDIYQDNYQPPASPPDRSVWLPGRGDGSFGEPRIFADAQLATTRAIAVGDVNVDGLPDLYLGNWYEKYFTGYEAFSNDLLLQFRVKGAMPGFVRWPMPLETATTSFDTDLGGRPTYGAALPRLDDGIPMLLELSYGRRWNRLYQMKLREPLRIPPGSEAPAPLELRDNRAA
ncbi:MAG: VCBS repeat-containing protein, partial [Verrucomicrobiae bacterium]|nr:VCBS repeat-containing protein [Verrucomicrobiae bacterium]